MKLFLDTSALIKRYVEERGTETVNSLCAQADEIILCAIALPEMISALMRRLLEGRISKRQYRDIKKAMLADWACAMQVDISHGLIAKTVEVLEQGRTRTLDALHVAAAAESGADLFATADKKHAQGASLQALKVEYIS
ncbi:MAG: type II toxin-antitoxin system VapC family toxin [bacterium]